MNDASKIHTIHLDGKELHEQFVNENTANFRHTRFFLNNSSEKISVLHRNNLTVTMRNMLDMRYPSGDFIIRNVWRFDGFNAVTDARRSITATLQKFKCMSPDIKILDKYLTDAYNRCPTAPRVAVVIDRIVPVRAIRELGTLYLHEEDLVLSLESCSHEILHPFSSEGHRSKEELNFLTENKASGLFVEIIDNERQTNSRFMFAGKRVMEVHAIEDPNRKSGIYFNHVENHPLSGQHLERQYCTLEEAEGSVGLYKTRDEAVSGGNPEIVSKIELELAKREAVQATGELERLKHEAAMVREDLQREQALRADQFEERKYQRSDFYENRSATRKDSSELIKFAAAAIGGAVAALGIIKAIK